MAVVVTPSPGFPVLARTISAQAFRERFIVEYCKDQNATNAYQRAAAPATVERPSAAASGARLLQDVTIRSEVEKRLHGRIRLSEITADRIQIELARMAFADPRKLYKRDTIKSPVSDQVYEVDTPIDITQLDDDTAAAIESIEHKPFGKTIKLASKQGALQTLAKIKGMVIERKSVTGRIAVTGVEDVGDDELDVIDGEYAAPALGTGEEVEDGIEHDEEED